MNDEYLWDRKGEPDPDVARLEKLLAPLAYQPPQRRRSRRWLWIPAAIAAGLVLFAIMRTRTTPAPETAWTIAENGRSRAIRQGETISTGKNASISLESSFVGEIKVDPDSRLRLVESRDRRQHFDLQRGVIHALIWAPPTQFVVDTPSAKTIDLGCRYTLRVGEDGTGLLTVDTGWVAFQSGGDESFIPAGAACVTRLKYGPGTPYFQDANDRLIRALGSFDQGGSSGQVAIILDSVRSRDAITLWHLLTRTEGADRQRVFTRFSEFVKLPPTVTSAAVLQGNRTALDAAWDALELGDTSWWRTWKRDWR